MCRDTVSTFIAHSKPSVHMFHRPFHILLRPQSCNLCSVTSDLGSMTFSSDTVYSFGTGFHVDHSL